MPIFKRTKDDRYNAYDDYREEEISLFELLQEDGYYTRDSVDNGLKRLTNLIYEFLDSTDSGKRFLKDYVKNSTVDADYREELYPR